MFMSVGWISQKLWMNSTERLVDVMHSGVYKSVDCFLLFQESFRCMLTGCQRFYNMCKHLPLFVSFFFQHFNFFYITFFSCAMPC